MRRIILLTGAVLVIAAGAVSGQVMMSGDPGLPGFRWAQANLEFPIGNVVSIETSPGVRMAGGFAQAFRLGLGARFYPLHGSDLGFRGYPYNARDLGHQFSPFVTLGTGVGVALPPEGQSFGVSNLAIKAHVELGARWYPFRTFVFSRAHLFDNIFMEVPIGYDLNISSLIADAIGYDTSYNAILRRELSDIPNLYGGIAIGLVL
jgi:hypothetical protein